MCDDWVWRAWSLNVGLKVFDEARDANWTADLKHTRSMNQSMFSHKLTAAGRCVGCKRAYAILSQYEEKLVIRGASLNVASRTKNLFWLEISWLGITWEFLKSISSAIGSSVNHQVTSFLYWFERYNCKHLQLIDKFQCKASDSELELVKSNIEGAFTYFKLSNWIF